MVHGASRKEREEPAVRKSQIVQEPPAVVKERGVQRSPAVIKFIHGKKEQGEIMSAIAIMTARGGSKRIPKKNMRSFCGKPILTYGITAALES